MSKYTYLILFLFYLFASSCQYQPENEINSISVNANSITSNIRLSNLVQDVEFIKLEDTERALISQIDKIEFYDSLIFILQRFADPRVLVYNKTGQYLRDLGSVGNGPGEFTIPYDIFIDKEKNRIIILGSNKLIYFDLKSLDYIDEDQTEPGPIRATKINDFTAYVYGLDQDELVISKNRSEIITTRFEKSVRNQIRPVESFHKFNEEALFHMTLYDTIYRIDKEGNIHDHLFINFEKPLSNDGLNNLPVHIKDNASELKKEFSNLMGYIKAYGETRSHVYFMFLYKNRFHAFLYNKNTNNQIGYDCFDVYNDVTFEPNAYYLYNNINETEFSGAIFDVLDLEQRLSVIDIDDLNIESSAYYNKLSLTVEDGDNSIANPIIYRLKFDF